MTTTKGDGTTLIELQAEADLYWLAAERRRRQGAPTRDKALNDADRSIAGWRERRDAALHYYYPEKRAA